MKVRNGFVSNSSSSSFVMVGAKIIDYNYHEAAAKLAAMYPTKVPEKFTFIDREDWEYEVCHTLDEYTKFTIEGDILGIKILSVEDYYISDSYISTTTVALYQEEVIEFLSNVGIAYKDAGIYFCTALC